MVLQLNICGLRQKSSHFHIQLDNTASLTRNLLNFPSEGSTLTLL